MLSWPALIGAAPQSGLLNPRAPRSGRLSAVTGITSFSQRGANLILDRCQFLISLLPGERICPGVGGIAMVVDEFVAPQIAYGRKLVRSGVQGARCGEEIFLHGKPLHVFLDESAWHALKPAALAACIAALTGYSATRHRSALRALAYGILGGTIGFGASLAWESRTLTASIASAAWRKIGRTRDEHWLEKNPIDYA